MELGVNNIEKILEKGDFDTLIGAYENIWLECKREPYRLESDHQKQELAKDISSIANARGGFLIIGIKTKLDETHKSDKFDEIRPFPSELIDQKKYAYIIENWIYPPIVKLYCYSQNSVLNFINKINHK